MQYYISWTHSDPIYHERLPNLGVLVSPPNVNQIWTVHQWPSLPPHLLLDSGAFQYMRNGRKLHPRDVLQRQLRMVADTDAPSAICHLDVPLIGASDPSDLQRRVIASLENAQWLIAQAAEEGVPSEVELVGVIQGHTVAMVYNVACVLADMGYRRFALGSLAPLAASAQDEALRRIEAAMEAVGTNLHVLGVSTVSLLPRLARLGIRSADSAAPMREAWLGGVFYSRPFRRYKLPSPHFREWSRSYGFAELLTTPDPCDCPVCAEDASRILEISGKSYVNLRALHNCYHLSREIADCSGTARVRHLSEASGLAPQDERLCDSSDEGGTSSVSVTSRAASMPRTKPR
jgi:tRNA-guanine family transglycosylase